MYQKLSKKDFRRKERLESLIRVLKKFKQSGVQSEQLDKKLENFTIECCYLSLKENNYLNPTWCQIKLRRIKIGKFLVGH